MGTETLMPGAAIPVHRHLHGDEVLFVYKGQGRATIGQETMTVVPGMMIYAPRQSWHSLRNTGTGILEITWLAAPPGIEEFFREYSRLGGTADAAALQALTQRYGIEFGPANASEPVGVPPSRHRHRRRRRGGGGPRQAATQSQQTPSGPLPAAAPVAQPGATVAVAPAPSRPAAGGRRHHRRRHRSGPAPSTIPATPPRPQTPPKDRPVRGRGPRRRDRIKEVYMGGRWIQVSGEGPVIDPGRSPSPRGRQGPRRDDDTPAGPLSVSL